MKLPPFNPAILISGLVILIVIGMAVFIFLYYLGEFGKLQEARKNEFDRLHDSIQRDIWLLPATSENYDLIIDKMKALAKLKWKDKEMTSVLTTEFLKRFAVENMKRHIETKYKNNKNVCILQ